MATSSSRRQGVLAALLNFFKIIVDPKADTLRIPAEFIKRYGHNLPNPVFLKVPSGPIMEVELVQSNGKTMLHKGWQEFKERYSIGFGHFLMFEYKGNSQFNVLIFDTTASEINYPFDAKYERVADQEPKLDDDGMESDDSVVFLEEFSTGNRGKGKYYPVKKSLRPMHNLSSCLKKDSRSKFSTPSYCSERIPDCRVKFDEPTSEERDNVTGRQCSDRVPKEKSVVKETCIAYQKALAFISDHTPHNPFFISPMQQSYISNKFNLNVPVSFAKRNLPFNSGNLIITVTNGKRWSVRCNVGNGRANLSAGWKDFVQDNGLKVGDACIFEVAKSAMPVWNVVIFRS